MNYELDWAFQSGQPPASSARFKQQPDDFQVVEELGFEPAEDEKGQHHWLWVEKRGANTEFVARQLAAFAGIEPRLVSFSGLKDRQAVTQQWFSVELPATRVIDWNGFRLELEHASDEDARILKHVRSGRKLRRGTHAANRFAIRLREVSQPADVEARLLAVQRHGVPNYFGLQRFGHGGANLSKAEAMFAGRRVKDRTLRSLYLSAARSFLFNQVVSARIERQLAHTPLAGDVFMLAGSQSFFCWSGGEAESENESAIQARLDCGDIRLTAPLWGRGAALTQAQAAEFEAEALAPWANVREGLERAGLKQERRALQLQVEDLRWEWRGDELELAFRLPAGAFATSVLRELFITRPDA